jgi:antitoxin (DNA-binding transcriptional repressor) of toxin-antitoxin stability system
MRPQISTPAGGVSTWARSPPACPGAPGSRRRSSADPRRPPARAGRASRAPGDASGRHEAELGPRRKLSPAARETEDERRRAVEADLRLGRVSLLAPETRHGQDPMEPRRRWSRRCGESNRGVAAGSRAKWTEFMTCPTMSDMKTVPAARFKAECLSWLDRVGPEGIVITKHGRPVAKLLPMGADAKTLIGSMRGHLRITGDILSTGIRWNAEPRHPRPAPRRRR